MNGPRENEAGVGQLRTLDGHTLLDAARYELTIEHAEIAGGLPYIHGHILNTPSGGFPPSLVDSEVLLRLEDGREWDCRLTDASGTLAPRGEHIRASTSDSPAA
jgi:hypothetical protein